MLPSFTIMRIVFGLSFQLHYCLLLHLQMFVFSRMCFAKWIVVLLHLFVVKSISLSFTFFVLHNELIIAMIEVRLVLVVNDLDFGIKNVAFQAKVFKKYGIFDQIANKSMGDPSYAYLHCDLLDKVALTIVLLRVKLFHIKMMKNICKRACLWRLKTLALNQNLKGVLRKVTCACCH